MNLYMCLLALGLALLAALPVEVTGKATVFVSIGELLILTDFSPAIIE